MSKIKFENGQVVNFDGVPTPQDIEEVSQRLGISQTQTTPFVKQQGFLSKATEPTRQMLTGIGKGLLSTFKGASSLGEKGLRGVTSFIPDKSGLYSGKTSAEKIIPEKLTKPSGTFESIGFGAEQLAEFLIPGGSALKAEKVASSALKAGKLAKSAGIGARALTEAAQFGGISAIQKGTIDDDVKTSAIVGALFPIAGAGVRGIRQSLAPIGKKIQTTVIRPIARDLKDGFDISNVSKYNLGGTLEQTATKTHITLNKLGNELKEILKASDEKIDLRKVVKETEKALMGIDKSKQFGDINSTRRVLLALKNEANEVSGNKGIVNLWEATNVKRGAGTKGAWVFGRTEPDASATEKVYTTFYSKIKNAIEKASPENIKGINKQMSELIPISNAVIRRLPIAQRNNVIGLTDSIGLFSAIFDPRALALIGANRLSKSGRFGKFLIDVAKNTPKTSLGERFSGIAK